MARRTNLKKPKKAPPLVQDQRNAAAIRARMVPHLDAICKLLDEGARQGLYVGFNLAPSPPDGLNHIQHINITRLL